MARSFYIAFFSLMLSMSAFSGGVQSLGIGPGIFDMYFQPNYTMTERLTVANEKTSPQRVYIEIEGDLKDYINLSVQDFTVYPGGFSDFFFTLTLPETLDTPGPHRNVIWATEIEPEGVPSGALGGRVAVGTIVMVRVPYPGKYLEAKLEVLNPFVNQTATFRVTATNRGNQTVEAAFARIVVYDPDGNEIAILNTNSLPIESKQEVSLEADWITANIKPGQYHANATVFYDENVTTLSKTFNLGLPRVYVQKLDVNPVLKDTVGKINTTVASEWNKRIDEIYLVVNVTGPEGYYYESKSDTRPIAPFGSERFISYWDTTDANPGVYTVTANVYYLGKVESLETKTEVYLEDKSFKFPDFGLKLEHLTLLLSIGVLVVVLILVIKKKKNEKGQSRPMIR